MNKYSEHRPCPKCGSREHTVEFEAASFTYLNGITKDDSILNIKCIRCGYKRQELPLDREEEENGN